MIEIPIPFTKYVITYGEENDTRPKMVFALPTGPRIIIDDVTVLSKELEQWHKNKGTNK